MNLQFAVTVPLQLCEGLIDNDSYLVEGSAKLAKTPFV